MLRKVCYIRERDFKKEIAEFKKRHVSRFSSQSCEKEGGDVAQVKVPKKKIKWGSRVGKDKKKQKLCSLYGG